MVTCIRVYPVTRDTQEPTSCACRYWAIEVDRRRTCHVARKRGASASVRVMFTGDADAAKAHALALVGIDGGAWRDSSGVFGDRTIPIAIWESEE